MKLTNEVGFNLTQKLSINETIQQAGFPIPDVSHHGWAGSYWGGAAGPKDRKVHELIRMANNAYITDGIVKQVVDRYTEMFKGFTLIGGTDQVKYLKTRLKSIALQTGDASWEEMIDMIILEYFKNGNAFINKYRGYSPKSEKRVLYKNRPVSVSGYRLMSAEKLEPHIDKEIRWNGWVMKFRAQSRDFLKLINPNNPNQGTGWLIEVAEDEENDNVLLEGPDIVHIHYRKGPDCFWGIGLTLAGLEDIALLRTIELNIAVMIKKYASPLYHHKITQIPSLAGPSNAIKDAYLMYQKAASDGIIITGANHEIKAIGSESQALRSEGYLNYFAKRGCIGIGMHPSTLGLDVGGANDGATFSADMTKRIAYCQQDLSNQIQRKLFNELLWEGGFDPWTNEDDEVKLQFATTDISAIRAEETHAADLFNKNAIDHDQLQDRIRNKKPVNPSKLYHNMIDKPLLDHEAKVKAGVAIAKARPQPKSVREQVYLNKPQNLSDVESLVHMLKKMYELDDTIYHVVPSLEALIPDIEAIAELVVQTICGEEYGR